MTTTIPNTDIGQEQIGYVLLALLSQEAQAHVVGLLDQLNHELPETIWCMPGAALHITLCEIYQPKEYSFDKTVAFEQNQQQYTKAARAVLAGRKKIAVHFDTIEASANAIIIRGTDDGSFNAIRAQLAQQLPLPADTKQPPDIIHSSIARYTKAVDLETVQAKCAKHQLDFDEEITEFKLLKCIVQPVLKYEVIHTYKLV